MPSACRSKSEALLLMEDRLELGVAVLGRVIIRWVGMGTVCVIGCAERAEGGRDEPMVGVGGKDGTDVILASFDA